MAVGQLDLITAASRNLARSQRSKNYLQRTGFLCHSHRDRDLALGLQQKLKEQGLDLYVDWQDTAMPETPDATTAARIKTVIRSVDVFLFLATSDSMNSRWCPWELGFSDGVKQAEQIVVIPTRDSSGNYYGNEYIQLYRRIDQTIPGGPLHWFQKTSQSPQNLGTF